MESHGEQLLTLGTVFLDIAEDLVVRVAVEGRSSVAGEVIHPVAIGESSSGGKVGIIHRPQSGPRRYNLSAS